MTKETNVLTKTEILLHRGNGDTDAFVEFNPAIGSDGIFVTIPEGKWHDLGDPDELTVTIEPGDRLND